MEVKNKIIDAVKSAVNSLTADGVFKSAELPEISLEVPPKKEFGDFATNFAMQSAKVLRMNPRKIAEEIKSRIDADFIDKIEIAGAGFMNFYLKADVIYNELQKIYDAENFRRKIILRFKLNTSARILRDFCTWDTDAARRRVLLS